MGSEDSDTAYRVSVKMPEFVEASAASWFIVLEAQFRLNNIKQESTQFFHAIRGLPMNLLDRLPPDVIQSESYSALQPAVLALVERSKPELFESLMTSDALIGRPSVCLTKLQQMGKRVNVGDDFIRHRFLQSLPPAIVPVLQTKSKMSLDDLGSLADELVAMSTTSHSSQPIQQVNAPYQKRSTNPFDYNFQHTPRRETASPHRRSQIARPGTHPNVRPFHNNQKPRICRAHIYYGRFARTCRSYCEWPDKQGVKIQPNSRPSSPAPSHLENEPGTLSQRQ